MIRRTLIVAHVPGSDVPSGLSHMPIGAGAFAIFAHYRLRPIPVHNIIGRDITYGDGSRPQRPRP